MEEPFLESRLRGEANKFNNCFFNRRDRNCLVGRRSSFGKWTGVVGWFFQFKRRLILCSWVVRFVSGGDVRGNV